MLSISLSLIAVFIPVLLMGGILGRMFREFTVTLSIAIIISLVVSLTATPMMSALFLRPRAAGERAIQPLPLRVGAGWLWAHPGLGAAPSPARPLDFRGHDRP